MEFIGLKNLLAKLDKSEYAQKALDIIMLFFLPFFTGVVFALILIILMKMIL